MGVDFDGDHEGDMGHMPRTEVVLMRILGQFYLHVGKIYQISCQILYRVESRYSGCRSRLSELEMRT
jgi:hypothetical protein